MRGIFLPAMERVKSLIGPSFAQNLAESNKVAAEEFASTIDKARTNRGAIDMKAGSRTISDATIAAGTRAVARAPKSGVDQFFQKYHYRYIKSGRCVRSCGQTATRGTCAGAAPPQPGARAQLATHPKCCGEARACALAAALYARCCARAAAKTHALAPPPRSAMPLVHLTLVVAACGIYLEHKRAWPRRGRASASQRVQSPVHRSPSLPADHSLTHAHH